MIDRDCPFWDRCFPTDEHHVWTLYRYQKQQKWALVQRGIRRVPDLPDTIKLTDSRRRQREALRTGRMLVETGLRAALSAFDGRLGVSRLRDHQPCLARRVLTTIRHTSPKGREARERSLPSACSRRPRTPIGS